MRLPNLPHIARVSHSLLHSLSVPLSLPLSPPSQLNRELLGEYTKRANNHSDLLTSLKDVNHMIQKAARLRMGDAKQRVVAACRVAIKANNTKSLLQIIKLGHPA